MLVMARICVKGYRLNAHSATDYADVYLDLAWPSFGLLSCCRNTVIINELKPCSCVNTNTLPYTLLHIILSICDRVRGNQAFVIEIN